MRTLTPDDPEYPRSLLRRASPPELLWVDGAPLSDARAVAIVGPREPSRVALEFAAELAERVAARGSVVVSGGAFGIDSAAHRGAIRSGKTWVVLPCAIEVACAGERKALLARVKAEGGSLVSTFPEGTLALRGHHHVRNTTIARMVTDMVVVQAARRSGSASVGAKGLAEGIRVFTFRGPCWDPLFAGTADLLSAGAVEPRSVDALVDALTAAGPRGLSDEEHGIVRHLRSTPIHVDELVEATSLPMGRVGSALLTLALDNVVVEGPPGYFRRNST